LGAENIFVAGLARIYMAPVGTIAPDGVDGVPMPDGWYDIGLFTPDSLRWSVDVQFDDIEAHQSNKPVRRIQTQDAATLEADLLEWTAESFMAVFGGGRIEKITPAGGGTPYYRFTPPSMGARQEISVCVELQDGNRRMRRIIPRAMQTEGVEQQIDRTSASVLPLRLSVLGSGLGDDYYDLFGVGFGPAFESAIPPEEL